MSGLTITLLIVGGVLLLGFGGCIVCLGGAAGFAVLGREEQMAPMRPKWVVGQVVDVEVTLVRGDRKDLACAYAEEVSGRHCAFAAPGKPWTSGDTSDAHTLVPYTTAEHIQFTAAGLWTQPALDYSKLPATRFNVKCKYKIEGTLADLRVRWQETGQWFPNGNWYAGSLSGCGLAP